MDAEEVQLWGIVVAAVLAAANLIWSVVSWHLSKKSIGAERLLDERRAALRAFRAGVKSLTKEVSQKVMPSEKLVEALKNGTEPELPPASIWLELYFVLQHHRELLAEHLHLSERTQLESLCTAFLDTVKPADSLLGNLGAPAFGVRATAAEQLQKDSSALQQWATHLLSPESIDTFLKGDAVVWNKKPRQEADKN